MPRMKAPTGGMVVNQSFHEGGQFLAKALKSIRSTAEKLVKLARPPEERKTLPGSAFTGAEVGHSEERPLTIRELRAVEDSHGIAKDKRLSNRVKPDDETLGEESTFRANKDHVAPFINELTKKRLVGHELRSRLADPSASDAKKMAYLVGHLATEAREFTDATQANGSPEWYGSHVDAYEHAIHNTFGIKPGSPEMTIVKALTAATSSSTNPRTNALAVYRMIRAGAKINPKNPLLGIPSYDHETLTNFREAAHKANGKPLPEPGYVDIRAGHAPHGAAKWYTDHVLPHKDLKESIGYRSRPAVIVDHPGSPDHGKLVEYQDNGEWIETSQAGGLYNKYRKTGKLKTVDMPDPDATGALRPKGWNARPSQVDNKLQQIQHLIKKYGAEGARDWLLTEHTIDEFKKEFNYKPAVNQLGVETAKGEKLKIPGMFVLGPKFGAFALNLHGNHPTDAGKHAKWLTADMWWSRTWNRMMGTLFTGAPVDKDGKPTKEVDLPRGPKERRWMTEAAQGAAKAAGLRNVAELQAVIWYYEQSLWRMLGVKQAKSYSFLDGAGAITAAHARDTGNGDLKDIAKRYDAILNHVAVPGKWTKEQRQKAMLDFLRTTAMDGQNDTAANRKAAEAKVGAVKLARPAETQKKTGLQALDTLAAKLKAEGRMPSRSVIVHAILSQMPDHRPIKLNRRAEAPAEHEHVLYVSPSTREGSTFDQAVAGYNSPDMVALSEAARLQPTVRHVEPALGMWSDGAEESNVVHVGDPEHLLPIAQKLGKAFKQKAVLTFKGGDGPDRRHIVMVPEQDPKAIDTLARHHGIEFKTMIRKPNGTRVEIVDMGGTLGPQVEEFAKASGATSHAVKPGTSNFVETA